MSTVEITDEDGNRGHIYFTIKLPEGYDFNNRIESGLLKRIDAWIEKYIADNPDMDTLDEDGVYPCGISESALNGNTPSEELQAYSFRYVSIKRTIEMMTFVDHREDFMTMLYEYLDDPLSLKNSGHAQDEFKRQLICSMASSNMSPEQIVEKANALVKLMNP